MRTYAVLNDIQIPFHDQPVLDAVLGFVKKLRPDGVVLNGDIVDCYELSVYDKDPLTQASLREEVDQARALVGRLRMLSPKVIWIGGNHEDRLRRYIWKRAPELGVLPGITFPKLFGLSDYGVEWRDYGESIMLGKLMVTHGSMVRSHSAYSAKAHFDRHGTSVMIGHTHRMGQFYRTNRNGVHAAYENGCLCRLDPEYVHDPDWQQGFAVVHVEERTGHFNVQQIPVLDRKRFFYGNQVFEIGG